jgi:CBS domain-containing protein
MPVGEICVREVVVCERNTTIREAARLMRQYHVGNLVIVEGPPESRKPVGIVTDRDLVVSVIALDVDARVFTVGDLVIQELVSVTEDRGVFETIQQMRVHGIRRMPVVDRAGGLAGIVSVDDLIQLLAEEMTALGKLISAQQAHEVEVKRV